MSLSTIDHIQTTTRHERSSARTHQPATRRRLRNARRALALVTNTPQGSTPVVPTARDHAVRLHPVELGPWDD